MENNSVNLLVDTKIYPLEAICKVGYIFVDQAYVFFDSGPFGKVKVSLKAKKKTTKKELESLKGEFLNELLHYTLRINLSRENKKIRQYIVEQAIFSAAEGEDSILNDLSFDDPLGIAIPWEEKYGNNEKKNKRNKIKKKNKRNKKIR